MNQEPLNESELQELRLRLEENTNKVIAKADKKRMKKKGTGNRTKRIDNPLIKVFNNIDFALCWPLWIDDVFSGICRLDWYAHKEGERDVPLSSKNMIRIFSTLPLITTYEISNLLTVGERQAQRYLKACELAYPYLIRGYLDTEIRSMRYWNVGEGEGISDVS